MFAVLVGIWLFVLLVGLAVVAYASIADRKLDGQQGGSGGEKFEPEMREKELRDGISAAPNTSWPPLPYLPKGGNGRFGRISPFVGQPADLQKSSRVSEQKSDVLLSPTRIAQIDRTSPKTASRIHSRFITRSTLLRRRVRANHTAKRRHHFLTGYDFISSPSKELTSNGRRSSAGWSAQHLALPPRDPRK